MILSDDLIIQYIEKNAISIEPFERANVRSASVSLRLCEFCARLEKEGEIDLKDSERYPELKLTRIEKQGMIIEP